MFQGIIIMTQDFTAKNMLKDIRDIARKSGLTLKIHSFKINGSAAYYFIDRKTKETVLSNCTLNSAYGNAMSGYLQSYNTEKYKFEPEKFNLC